MGPAELNERNGRNGLSPITKRIGSALIVLFLGSVATYTWNLHTELQGLKVEVAKDYVLMGVHRQDLDKLYEFMVEGKRFTLDRGEGAERDILAIKEEHEALRLVVHENTLTIARMPVELSYPFTPLMQQRLANAEKAIALNKQSIDELNRNKN